MNKKPSAEFNLKAKVLDVLAFHKYTFSQLAEYLGTTEKELDTQFENNSLEVRTLELMSKALRIPLYSFFREGDYDVSLGEEQYYNIDIWGKDGIKLRAKLNDADTCDISDKELEKLKMEIKELEKLIHQIETKRKKK
jgi:transcriptional regulator with XRE-family HTH domain